MAKVLPLLQLRVSLSELSCPAGKSESPAFAWESENVTATMKKE